MADAAHRCRYAIVDVNDGRGRQLGTYENADDALDDLLRFRTVYVHGVFEMRRLD